MKLINIKKYIPILENILIFLFILILPFEKRHIFFNISPNIDSKPYAYTIISIYLSDIIVFTMILFLVFRNFKSKLIKRLPYKFTLISLIFISLLNLSLSPRETYIYFFYIKTIEIILLAIYFSIIFRKKTQLILKSISVSAVIQSIIAILQFTLQHSLGLKIIGEQLLSKDISGVAKLNDGFIRSYGTFTHPNQLAAFLFVACATTIYLFFETNSKIYSSIYGISIFIIVYGLITTFSRNAILSFILTELIFIFLTYKYYKNKVLEKLPKLLIILLITITASVSIMYLHINSRLTIFDQSTQQRINYDQIGWNIFLQHPIYGVGIGKMQNYIFSYMQKPNQIWEVQPAHNFYIDVLCETGLIGFIIYMIFFSKILTDLFANIKKTENKTLNILFLSIFIGILSSMLFDHFFYTQQQNILLLWMIIGIIMGLQIDTNKIEFNSGN